jgi:hypothetical protein
MTKPRVGRTRTLSISVDPTTDRILKEEAAAHFEGNVSKLVAAIAREARRKAAVDRIAQWSGYSRLSGEDRDEIQAGIQKELAAQKPEKRRKKRSAA